MYKTILVPLDNSATAQRGLREAIGLARVLGAKLTLVHVINPLGMASEAAVTNSAALHASLRESGANLLAEAKRHAGDAGVNAETVLVAATDGRIDKSVLDAVRDKACDLVVMGTHGREGITRLVLGSDAELVVRGSTVPVLLVPDPPAP